MYVWRVITRVVSHITGLLISCQMYTFDFERRESDESTEAGIEGLGEVVVANCCAVFFILFTLVFVWQIQTSK